MLTTGFHEWKLVVMKSRDPTSSPFSPQTEAITSLTLTVFRLNGELLQWGDALVEPLGLTSARWQMLGAIALAGVPLTAPQIGQAMGVTRQGAQKQLNLLLEQGFIESRPNPAHRRSPQYVMTPQGRELYLQAEGLWAEQTAELAARIPAAQVQSAVKTLESMLQQLQPLNHPLEIES
ncbi:MarR family winged helix-turn-helix transcriptional regulator [Azohydromonas lata]|uniref:MarR family winged helix-turn-helix transcriptional regulator n=1 Tax=Azohydromonas lata TaxID=45677 RepID=A0ABU5INU4_9BURK|nr:MarR family winged helix-turn-helix transcriptional regulator [Azohydromonas lata]MDZ5460578.1 MarR family winged helix-turn-helix transcriptional regulator [Azohydromonas lata]